MNTKFINMQPHDRRKFWLAAGCLGMVLGLAACEQEGPAEKTGKEIDQATEKAGKQIESVKKEVVGEAESIKQSMASNSQIAGEYIDDSVITAKIKEGLMADDFLKGSRIEVTTVKGAVTLGGTVDSEQLIGRAVGLANSREGVKSVQNNLVLQEAAVK